MGGGVGVEERTELQRLRMQSRSEQRSIMKSRWGSWCGKRGHTPRLPAPKQHHQYTQAAAAAAAAAVIEEAGGGRRVVEQRANPHATHVGFPFLFCGALFYFHCKLIGAE